MKQKFSNNAETTLNATILSGATSFTVGAGGGAAFPTLAAGEHFYVRLGTNASNEVVKVTARSSDVFTCDATAGGWAAGADVKLTVSAESLGEMAQSDGGGAVLEDHELRDIAETVAIPSSSSGTLTLDCETANVFEVTLTENVTTLNITNPAATGKATAITLIRKQDGTGNHTMAWPAGIKWPGGAAPTLSTAVNSVDIVTLITIDGGTVWYGFTGGLAFA